MNKSTCYCSLPCTGSRMDLRIASVRLLLSLSLLSTWTVTAQVIPEQLGLFVPIPFTVDAKVNGIQTQLTGAQVRCSDQQPVGTIQVGNYDITLECIPPQARYRLVELGRVPTFNNLHDSGVQFTGDINQLVDSVAATQASLNSTMRQLLSFWDSFSPIGGFIGSVLGGLGGSGCDNCASQDSVIALNNSLGQLGANFNQLKGQVVGFTSTMSQMSTQIANVFNKVDTVTAGFRNEIDALEDSQNKTQSAITSINAAIRILGKNTDEVAANLTTAIALAELAMQQALQAEDAAIRQEFGRSYTYIGAVVNSTQTQFQDVNYNIQQQEDLFNTFLGMFYRAYNSIEERRLITAKFFRDLDQLPVNEIPMIYSNYLRPQAEFKPTDYRVLYESALINFVDVGIGSPNFIEIKSVQVSLYGDTLYWLQNVVPYLSLQSVLRTIGPSQCTRPLVLDASGNPVPESASFANLTSCSMWVEITTTSCQAANATFNWRTADPTKSSTGQDGLLHSSYCKNSVSATSTTTVIRSLGDLQAYFAVQICGANLNPTSLQEFQLVMVRLQQIGYIAAAGSPMSLCLQSFQAQAQSSANSLLFIYLQGLQLAMRMFLGSLESLDLTYYGSLPIGVVAREQKYNPRAVRRNTDGTVIPDGASDYRRIVVTWASASTTVVPVQAIFPIANGFIQTGINIDTVVPAANFTPDYVVTQLITNAEFTSQQQSLLPGEMMWIGDPTVTGPPAQLYDVPRNLLTIPSDPRGLVGTALEFLMPPGTTSTLTLEQYQALNGPLWDPTSFLLTPSSWLIGRGVDADNFPYCNVPVATPPGINATTSNLIGYGVVPNSDICTVLSAFKFSKVLAGGHTEINLSPISWTLDGVVQLPSGKITTVVDSSCPDTTMSPVNATTIAITLQNQLSTINTVVIKTTSLDITEQVACTASFTVQVPPAPVPKRQLLPTCKQLQVTVFRIAPDPANINPPSLVQCGDVISATATDEAVQSYAGIPIDVQQSIANATSTVNANIAGAAATAYLITSVFNIMIANSIDRTGLLAALLEQARQQVLNNSFASVVYPAGATPVTTSVLAGVTSLLEQAQTAINNFTFATRTDVQGLHESVQTFLASDFASQFALFADQITNITDYVQITRLPGAVKSCSGLYCFFRDIVDLAEAVTSPVGNIAEKLADAGLSGLATIANDVQAVAEFAGDRFAKVFDSTLDFFSRIGNLLGSSTFWIIFLVIFVILGAIAAAPIIAAVKYIRKAITEAREALKKVEAILENIKRTNPALYNQIMGIVATAATTTATAAAATASPVGVTGGVSVMSSPPATLTSPASASPAKIAGTDRGRSRSRRRNKGASQENQPINTDTPDDSDSFGDGDA